MDEKLERNIKGIPNFVANSKNFEKTFCFYDEYFAGDNADNSPLWAASCQGPGQQRLASHSRLLIEKWTSKNI